MRVAIPLMKQGDDPDLIDLKKGRYDIGAHGALIEFIPDFEFRPDQPWEIPIPGENILLEFAEIKGSKLNCLVNLEHDAIPVVLVVGGVFGLLAIFGVGFLVHRVDKLLEIHPVLAGGIIGVPLILGAGYLLRGTKG